MSFLCICFKQCPQKHLRYSLAAELSYIYLKYFIQSNSEYDLLSIFYLKHI